MSGNGYISNRLVKLDLENDSFERKSKQSMGTIDKLQSKLESLSGARGLEEVEAKARETKFEPLLKAADTVTQRLSNWGVVGMAALEQITKKAIDAGVEIARSFSGIENMRSGYEQYVQVNSANRTLVNTTHKSLQEVKNTVGILSTFADETSYSLQQMQMAMGTMTSAGGDMKDLTPMLMGIANAASFAGRSASEYAGIINQITQSYPSGALKSEDFQVMNRTYGLFSDDLMKVFIETGKEVGTLDAQGRTLGKHLEVTTANFGETLKQNWATVEVMEKAFGKFGNISMKAIEIMNDESNGIDTLFDAYASLEGQVDSVALAAARSAQETKTVQEAIEATKVGIASQWSRIFEAVIGDVDESVDLWSSVADRLYTMFIEPQSDTADFISDVMGKHDGDFADTLNDSGIAFEKFKAAVIEDATDSGVLLLDDMVKKANTFRDVLNLPVNAESFTKVLKQMANGTATAQDNFTRIKAVIDDVTSGKYGSWLGEQQKNLAAAGYEVEDLQSLIKEVQNATKTGDLSYFRNLDLWAGESDKTILDLAKTCAELGDSLSDTLNEQDADTGRLVLLRGLSNIINGITDRLDVAKEAFKNIFPSATAEDLYTYLQKFETLTEKFKMTEESADKISAVFSRIGEIVKSVGGVFKGLFDVVTSVFNLIGTLANKYFGTKKFDFAEMFDTKSGDLIAFLDNVAQTLEKISAWIDDIANSKAAESIKSIFEGGDRSKAGVPVAWLTGIIAALTVGVPILEDWLAKFDKLKELLTKTFTKSIRDLIYDMAYAISEFADKLRADVVIEFAGSVFLIAAAIWILSTIDWVDLAKGIGAVAAVLAGLFYAWIKLREATSNPFSAGGIGEFFTKTVGRLLDVGDMAETAKGFMYIAAAVLVMSAALWVLSKIPFMDLVKGLAAMAVTIFVMLRTLMALQEGKPVYTTLLAAIAFIGLAAAMVLVAAACAIFALIGDKVVYGLFSIAVILAVVTIAFKELSKSIKDVGALMAAAAALLLVGAALLIISAACAVFALIGDKLWWGMLAMVVTLTAVTLAFQEFSKIANPGTVLVCAAALVILSVALIALGAACMVFAYLPENCWGNLIIMAAAVMGMLYALNYMQNATEPGKILAVAAAILVMSAAALVLSFAVKSFSELGLDGIYGLFDIAAALIIFGEASQFITPARSLNLIVLAAALTALSVGIAALALAMSLFKGSQLTDIINGLVAVGGTVAIFTAAAYALQPISPILLALVGTFDLFAAGLWVVADGIEKAADGFSTFVDAVERLGSIDANFSDITSSIVNAIQSMHTTIKGTSESFTTDGKDVVQAFQNGVDSVQLDLAKPINTALTGINSLIAAYDASPIGVSLSDKLSNAFSLITFDTAVIDASFASLLETSNAATIFIELAKSVADTFIRSFVKALNNGKGEARTAAKQVAAAAKAGFTGSMAHEAGNAFGQGFINGVSEKQDSAYQTGSYFGQGFVNGILDKEDAAYKAGWKIGNAAKRGAEEAGKVASPSREMYAVGNFYQKGFVNALLDNIGTVYTAAHSMGEAAIQALDAVVNGGDTSGITPVLDMSNVYRDMAEIDGIWRPVIKPTLDMSDVNPAMQNMSAVSGMRQYAADSTQTAAATAAPIQHSTVSFTQNNYSPKPLSRLEIYRQTKNQLAALNL